MKICYTVRIVLKDKSIIEIDGYFDSLDSAREMWELTRKLWLERGYIKVSDKFIYYLEPIEISYVRIAESKVGES
ncbi:MAG: hypothetical protein ABIB98_00480 [bacterium]